MSVSQQQPSVASTSAGTPDVVRPNVASNLIVHSTAPAGAHAAARTHDDLMHTMVDQTAVCVSGGTPIAAANPLPGFQANTSASNTTGPTSAGVHHAASVGPGRASYDTLAIASAGTAGVRSLVTSATALPAPKTAMVAVTAGNTTASSGAAATAGPTASTTTVPTVVAAANAPSAAAVPAASTVSHASKVDSIPDPGDLTKEDDALTGEERRLRAVAQQVKHQAAFENAVVHAIQADPAKSDAVFGNKQFGSDVAALVGKHDIS